MLTQHDLRQIELIIDKVSERKLGPISKNIKAIKKEMKEVRRSVNIISDYFDRETIELTKRVSRIEGHLNLSN